MRQVRTDSRASASLVGGFTRCSQAHPTRLWEMNLAKGPAPGRSSNAKGRSQVLTFTSELNHGNPGACRAGCRARRRPDRITCRFAGLFRQLFPGEVLSPGQLAAVSTVTLMAVQLDPAQADRFYQELGESRAFNVFHELFQLLDEAVRNGRGAVIKTVGKVSCVRSMILHPLWGSAFSSRGSSGRAS